MGMGALLDQRGMIPIGSIAGQVEVGIDLPAKRVTVIILATGWHVWLTDAEAEALAEKLGEAARELRRRRGGP